jgi:methionine synthase I (cobalamin-dependent)
MGVAVIQNRSAEFKEALLSRVLVADGAMGTSLYGKGIFLNRCYDELNLSLPALIRDVHQEYLRAGAEIIETNTFGANRKRLAAFGFAERRSVRWEFASNRWVRSASPRRAISIANRCRRL